MRTLLLDNYDSYTYNLFDLIARVTGHAPMVIRADTEIEKVMRLIDEQKIDNIVISPGPGSPTITADIGCVLDVIRKVQIPVLGVCLGHQAIAHVYGATVSRAAMVRHGYVGTVELTDSALTDDLWKGIPKTFKAVRYHSLAVTNLPDELEAQAWSCGEDVSCCMALRHKDRHLWGVQFHPESILSEQGYQLIHNFSCYTINTGTNFSPDSYTSPPPVWWGRQNVRYPATPNAVGSEYGRQVRSFASNIFTGAEKNSWIVKRRSIPFVNDIMTVFENVFYDADRPCVFLDSSSTKSELRRPDVRFSILGAGKQDGAGVSRRKVRTERVVDGCDEKTLEMELGEENMFFSILEQVVAATQSFMKDEQEDTNDCDFKGGWVGFCGYELKAEVHEEKNLFRYQESSSTSEQCSSNALDAGWIFLDRFLLIDHRANTAELVTIGPEMHRACDFSENWFDDIEGQLSDLGNAIYRCPFDAQKEETLVADEGKEVLFTLRDEKEKYLKHVEDCVSAINRGDSYELCLTTQISSDWRPCPMLLYKTLRISNPAPYQAFLSFGKVQDHHDHPFQIVSFSPERFLRSSSGGEIKVKPMKGTSRRGFTSEEDRKLALMLAEDDKERAENLMIVDLMRNDLSVVSDVDTVKCRLTELMQVETFASYHQLVSTVRAKLRKETSVVDALRMLFPPGSMTGAPKIRSMQLLENLEKSPRGPYSGVLGYISQFGKATNLAVMIRTVVLTQNGCSTGAGGAITALSSPQQEFEEMLVKCRPALRALALQAPGKRVRLQGKTESAECAILFEPPTLVKPESAHSDTNDENVCLLETMAVSGSGNVILLEYHHDRLEKSAAVLSYACPSMERFRTAINQAVSSAFDTPQDCIVRLTLAKNGRVACAVRETGNVRGLACPTFPFPQSFTNPVIIYLDKLSRKCPCPHKTTERGVYDAARAGFQNELEGHGACRDVLLFNEQGNLTETTIYNIAIKMSEDEIWITPTLASGLLDGVARRFLLDRGEMLEKDFSMEDVEFAQGSHELWSYPRFVVFNSVRGILPARIVSKSCRETSESTGS